MPSEWSDIALTRIISATMDHLCQNNTLSKIPIPSAHFSITYTKKYISLVPTAHLLNQNH